MKNRSFKRDRAIDKSNPVKQESNDWWDELCKEHGEKNHWKKEKPKKSAKKKNRR